MLDDVGNVALLLLTKIAQADGKIEPFEKELLIEFSSELSRAFDYEALEVEAQRCSINTLCEVITNEADRFFLRLRCHLMVIVDGEVTSDEQGILDQIIEKLPLSEKLETLLEQTIDHQLVGAKEPNMSSIHKLYNSSSFAS